MQLSLSTRPAAQVRGNLLVLAATPKLDGEALGTVDRRLGGTLLRFVRQRRARGVAQRPITFQPPAGKLGCALVLVVPVERLDPPAWRRIADAAVGAAREHGARTLALALDGDAPVEVVAECLHLSAYSFAGLRSNALPDPTPKRVLLLHQPSAEASEGLRRGLVRAAATCLARDLVNLPADVVTPSHLAAEARRLGRQKGLRARVHDEPAIRRLGMGALLGVARGSSQPPRFLELAYRPERARRRVALVGKGITFDSGGLSLKSPQSMLTQKRDMAGGATVLAVMSALPELGPKVEVRGYVPCTENMPSGTAIKPGDVVRTYGGKTVEVLNTDAEGRLVLADALSYAVAANPAPEVIIDCATLTGAVRMALGNLYAAVMATDGDVLRDLMTAASAAGENLWELPLVNEYRPDLDSTVADLKNMGEGRAGTIVAGLFLREFVGEIPWAHIDFSSTAVAESPFPGHPKGASGFGVRTLLNYICAI